MHLDARNFSFPNTFWPDRWLLASGRVQLAALPLGVLAPDMGEGYSLDVSSLNHNETAFMPFSYGPMNCVGKNLALAEIRMVASTLIRQFEFRLKDGWEVEEYRKGFRDYGIATRPRLPVLVTRRNS